MTAPPNDDTQHSASERLTHSLDRIARDNEEVGAFTDVMEGRARSEAATADRRRPAAGRAGLLNGLPIGVKALFDVEGGDNSYGSDVRDGARATRDATVVERLCSAGAVIVGVTRSHEFGWGITTQHETRGSTRNPWDLSRVPGGSSGGSAAAVAAGMVPFAVGSDTGGSVRIPAAFCGVLGLKTTLGRVSGGGGVALAPSFDSPGFFARTVDLLAAALEVTVGPDDRDPRTLASPELVWPNVEIATVRFTVAQPTGGPAVTAERVGALENMSTALLHLGARHVESDDLPDRQKLLDIFVPHQMAEAHYVHTQLLGSWPSASDVYGADVQSRLVAAGQVNVDAYLEALFEARAVRAVMERLFLKTDILVDIVGAHGPSTVDDPDNVLVDGASMPLRATVMTFTVLENLAGLPSLTIPVGFDRDGLPIAVQLTGAPWSEPFLLEVGAALENAGAFTVPVAKSYAPT